MSSEKGMAFLLKVGDGGDPSDYATVAGLRATREEWEAQKLSIAGTGIFVRRAPDARLKTNALAGLLDDYELVFEDGRTVRGWFLIVRLDYIGDTFGEHNYAIALESANAIEVASYRAGQA